MCKIMDSDCYCHITKDTCQSNADKCEHVNPVPDKAIKKIYVCSPYGGKEENYQKAVKYCKYVAAQGHIPFASHVMLHGIMEDVGETRQKGLTAGKLMIPITNETWVFDEITSGMRDEITISYNLDHPVVYIFPEAVDEFFNT